MNKPLLSICIPTFRRPAYLKDCLEAIFFQIENNPDLKDKVEVVISDNASGDETAEVVNVYLKKHNNLKYFCNNFNIGPDENYINSVIKSSGSYAWLIGDDDFILNGSIEFVLDFLSNNRVSILTFPTQDFYSMTDVLKKKSNFSNLNIVLYNSHDIFFKKGYVVGVLCTMIFDRDLWIKTDRSGYSSGWSYYEIALNMIANSSLPMAHLADQVVAVRKDCEWIKDGAELFTYINSNLVTKKMMIFGYDKKRLSQELRENKKRLPLILLRAKGHDLKCSLKNLYFIYSNFEVKTDWYVMLLATLIFFVPNKIIMLIRNVKKFIN